MTIPLTEAQTRILRAVQQISDETGRAPTVLQLASACGYASTNTVHLLLDRLVERGWVRRTPGLKRGLELLRRLPEPGTEGEVVTMPADEYRHLLAQAQAWQAHQALQRRADRGAAHV